MRYREPAKAEAREQRNREEEIPCNLMNHESPLKNASCSVPALESASKDSFVRTSLWNTVVRIDKDNAVANTNP